MRRLAGLGLIIIVIVITGLYFSPHYTVHQMKAAIAADDVEKIAEYMDVAAVRANLKQDLSAKLQADTDKRSSNPLLPLGAALMSAVASPMIDFLVTPHSLAMLLQGESPDMDEGIQTAAQSSNSEGELMMDYGYQGIDIFVMTVRKSPQHPPIAFVLSRQADMLSWKVTAIRLP